MAIYKENEDLISIGAYQKGANPQIDRAIALRGELEAFLSQPQRMNIPWKQMEAELKALAAKTA